MPAGAEGSAIGATPREQAAADGAAAAGNAWYVPLKGATPLAIGGEKEIFERPGKPSQIVKVYRAEHIERVADSRRLKVRLRRMRATAQHKNLIRQYGAYLEAMLMAPRLGRPPPLAQPRGLVLTDLGLGQLYQKIRDERGHVAPTLRGLYSDGRLTREHVGPLNALVADVYAFNLVVTDRNSHNIVLETRRGRRRFVLIDGFGVRTALPVRRWSRRANARSLDILFERMGRKIGLAWDRSGRRFRFAADPADTAPVPPDYTPAEAWTIPLDGAAVLAAGARRDVYERPGKPSQVVKVARRGGTTGGHRALLRQYRAFLDAMLVAPDIGRPPPLAQPRGLALTDRGLGQLCQKIRDDAGRLAPTLKQLAQDGRLDDALIDTLDAFAADLAAFDIVLSGAGASDLVLETRKGRSRFVLVDGFGDLSWVPLRRWWRALNRRSRDRALARIAAEAGLAWDPAVRRFRRSRVAD